MLKQVLIGLSVLVLAVFAYVGYTSFDARRSSASADVLPGEGRSIRPRADMSVVPNDTGSAPITTLPAMPTTSAENDQVTAQGSPAASAPATDTISANPPNGMIFSGTGHFQLYRQGNLTWRLDTDTGQSCILFATDEEWRKPKVFNAGCRRK